MYIHTWTDRQTDRQTPQTHYTHRYRHKHYTQHTDTHTTHTTHTHTHTKQSSMLHTNPLHSVLLPTFNTGWRPSCSVIGSLLSSILNWNTRSASWAIFGCSYVVYREREKSVNLINRKASICIDAIKMHYQDSFTNTIRFNLYFINYILL